MGKRSRGPAHQEAEPRPVRTTSEGSNKRATRRRQSGRLLATASAWRTVVVVLACAGTVAACSSTLDADGTPVPGESSGAPPLVVCGTTLWSGADGAILTDATGARTTLTSTTSNTEVMLQFTSGCSRGVRFTIDPSDAAKTVKEAKAGDGQAAAVALYPQAASFDVNIARADGSTGVVRVRLGSPPPPSGGYPG